MSLSYYKCSQDPPGTFHSTALTTKCLVSNTENLFGIIEASPKSSIHIISFPDISPFCIVCQVPLSSAIIHISYFQKAAGTETGTQELISPKFRSKTGKKGQRRGQIVFHCWPFVGPGQEQTKANHACWWFRTLLT